MLRNTSQLAIILSLLGMAGAVAAACSGSSEDAGSTCDPGPCEGADSGDVDGGELDAGTLDGGELDASVPGADVGMSGMFPPGSTILPDGAVVLPDGAIVTGDAFVGCVPGSTQCTNCKDDDGDGLIDWLDPECTGPLDNDENSFATGIPGDNIDPCKQDCWFDGNSGSGNDGCLFNSKCLKGSTEAKCPYDPVAAADPKQCPPPSEKCIKYCKPLTPKGCDCAGCCQVFDPTGKMYSVKLAGSCTYEALGDATKCPTCTQIPDCNNPCGKCDFCLGKLTLPADCYPPAPDAGTDAPPPTDAGTPGDCPAGMTKCSPSSPCAAGQYCLTGCCITPPR